MHAGAADARCTSTTGCAARSQTATPTTCASSARASASASSCWRAPPPPRSGNLQAWARDLRYARAALLAGADAAIATGHTASDQVETVLYRLAASPGRRALLGMAAREGRLVRPLLALTREQTAAHCRSRGLAWREDSSNEDAERFARARVRHGVLPAAARRAPGRRAQPAAQRRAAARPRRRCWARSSPSPSPAATGSR